MKRVVLYDRVSRGEDKVARLHTLRRWAKQRGWRVVGEFVDNITGDPHRRKGDPPELRRALRMVAARDAEGLVVFSATRLVRSATGLLNMVTRIQSFDASVSSYEDGADLDTLTLDGELM